MSCSSFKKGTEIKIKEKSYVLRKKTKGNSWQCEDINSGDLIEFSSLELQKLYTDRALVFRDGFITEKSIEHKKYNFASELSKEEWESLKIRKAYVMAVMNAPITMSVFEPLIKGVSQQIGKDLPIKPPSWISVYRWKKRYIGSELT